MDVMVVDDNFAVRPGCLQIAFQRTNQSPAWLTLHFQSLPAISTLCAGDRHHGREKILKASVGRFKIYEGVVSAVGSCNHDSRRSKINSNLHYLSILRPCDFLSKRQISEAVKIAYLEGMNPKNLFNREKHSGRCGSFLRTRDQLLRDRIADLHRE